MKYRDTKQRQRILQLLRSTHMHPTADWLFTEMKKEFTRVSLGTIYRNLTILNRQGLINKIHSNSTFDRFEANTGPHYHAICEKCGKTEDLEMPILLELNERVRTQTDFWVRHHRIEFYGKCSECKNKTDQDKPE